MLQVMEESFYDFVVPFQCQLTVSEEYDFVASRFHTLTSAWERSVLIQYKLGELRSPRFEEERRCHKSETSTLVTDYFLVLKKVLENKHGYRNVLTVK